MNFGVVVFPGSNCDVDAYHVIKNVIEQPVDYVWHEETNLSKYDCIVLPGGFAYGDALRCGAIARFSPVMQAVQEHAAKGKLVIGICNGFQILVEARQLPGALIKNAGQRFACKFIRIRCENTDTPFTRQLAKGQVLSMPIAHGEGNYYCDAETLAELKANNQIIFRYVGENPNGSLDDIAGICNRERNVFGMMPHPERASETILGSQDGRGVWESILSAV
jgi:phosphoribosylformylglycinamidine synthase